VPAAIWQDPGGCEHTWGDEQPAHKPGQAIDKKRANRAAMDGQRSKRGRYCTQDCGAWQGLLGLEPTIDLFVANVVEYMRHVKRALRVDGSAWINIGDSYASNPSWGRGRSTLQGRKHSALAREVVPSGRHTSPGVKEKDLFLAPQAVALALRADGWYVRSFFPWLRRNAMPESINDRPTNGLEWIIYLSKSKRYYADPHAVRLASSKNTHSRGHGLNPKALRAPTEDGVRPRQNPSFSTAVSAVLNTRARRNTDWFDDSLLDAIGWHEQQAAELRQVRQDSGLLLSEDDTPIALVMPTEGTQDEHFASFGESMVLPMLLFSTSEKGVCPTCGAPVVRKVEPSAEYAKFLGKGYHDHTEEPLKGRSRNRGNKQSQNVMRDEGGLTGASYVTVGWEPSCKHTFVLADAMPAIVLDPFSGRATTGVVARRRGRRYIGIEASFAYWEMGNARLEHDVPPLFAGLL
jgi:DNA modification methylase